MPYRPEWFVRFSKGRLITEIAQDVSETCRGSSEHLTEGDFQNDMACLEHVVETWRDPYPNSIGYEYDIKVKELIECAIKMANKED